MFAGGLVTMLALSAVVASPALAPSETPVAFEKSGASVALVSFSAPLPENRDIYLSGCPFGYHKDSKGKNKGCKVGGVAKCAGGLALAGSGAKDAVNTYRSMKGKKGSNWSKAKNFGKAAGKAAAKKAPVAGLALSGVDVAQAAEDC